MMFTGRIFQFVMFSAALEHLHVWCLLNGARVNEIVCARTSQKTKFPLWKRTCAMLSSFIIWAPGLNQSGSYYKSRSRLWRLVEIQLDMSVVVSVNHRLQFFGLNYFYWNPACFRDPFPLFTNDHAFSHLFSFKGMARLSVNYPTCAVFS